MRVLSGRLVSLTPIIIMIGCSESFWGMVARAESNDCSCMDSKKVFQSLSNCKTSNGEKGIIFDSPPSCFPINYGSETCAAHDLTTNPLCRSSSDILDLPEFCHAQWCYVDVEKCKRTKEAFHLSTYGQMYPYLENSLFYSYSLCNHTHDVWEAFVSTQVTEGKTLTVTIPAMWPPFHHKTTENGTIITNSSGPEYYNDHHSWKGVFIDYFNTVVEISNLAGINYTYRSGFSDELTSSPYSAAVADVQRGLTDMTLSSFWVTSERLSMTSFTQPIYMDRIELFVKQPGKDDLSVMKNALKLLNPFTRDLWLIVIALLFIVSGIHVWFSTANERQDDLFRRLRPSKWKKATYWNRIQRLGQTLFESLMMFSIYLFGGSVEYHREATMSQKILTFGFSLVILVAVVSYTANLTAFLTISSVVDFPSSMEEAIRLKKTVCAVQALQKPLSKLYPKAEFFFSNFDTTMREDYKKGLCDILLLSTFDAQYSPENVEFLCENDLVTTGSVAMETSVAFPIKKKYVASISYWLKIAENQDITFDSFAKQIKPSRPSTCEYKISLGNNDFDELRKLGPQNLFLPILVCTLCIGVAVITHLLTKFQPTKNLTRGNFKEKDSPYTATKEDMNADACLEANTCHNQLLPQNISEMRDMIQDIMTNQKEILEKMGRKQVKF